MARAPMANTRPVTEQKIHTGKKEPKMLYSGACAQPTNGAIKDNAAIRQDEGIRDRSRSVDSRFTSTTPHTTDSWLFDLSGPRELHSKAPEQARMSIEPQSEKPNLLDEGIGPHLRIGGCVKLLGFRSQAQWTEIHQHFRFHRYLRPMDSAPLFCLNRLWTRKIAIQVGAHPDKMRAAENKFSTFVDKLTQFDSPSRLTLISGVADTRRATKTSWNRASTEVDGCAHAAPTERRQHFEGEFLHKRHVANDSRRVTGGQAESVPMD